MELLFRIYLKRMAVEAIVPTILFWFTQGQVIPELGRFTDFGIQILDFGLVEDNLPS